MWRGAEKGRGEQKRREKELGVWPIVMVLSHRGEQDRGVEVGEEWQKGRKSLKSVCGDGQATTKGQKGVERGQ